ncbi:MAG: arginine--tRNA ligase [Desulfurococcales archaeon]|nr:arginine--tRNA ligase [Desulfurococcales archaeon]
MTDPYSKLIEDVATRIIESINKSCKCTLVIQDVIEVIEEPPRREFGDIAVPVPRLLKKCRVDFKGLVSCVKNGAERSRYAREVKVVGPYVNIFIDMQKYGKDVISALRQEGESYGFSKRLRKRVVVEYVSANPVHPLHIGSGRNAALGEFIARVFELNGSEVERRYYVNDLGLQVAYLAYGYMLLNRPNPPSNMKIDHFMGLIYAATATLIDIMTLKKEVEKAKSSGDIEKYRELSNKLSELLGDLEKIRSRLPEYVDVLIDKIKERQDPLAEVYEIMRKYEKGDPEISGLVKEAVEKVMAGIRATLDDLGIAMDKWDWESDLVRENLVSEILGKALKSPYLTMKKGVPALDFSGLLKDEELKVKLKIHKFTEVPPLVLMRSDGTTLYTTRDIAYTIKKFKEFNADSVVNVIAAEQTLPQAQLRLALYVLGYRKEAENLIHYAYEMVTLPGSSMSGRRGRYVTIDEILDELKAIARKLMVERGAEPKDDIILKIARSAFKYIMLSASPSKPIVFDASKAMDIKANSAPYLMYTYARANSVLMKCDYIVEWDRIDYEGCEEGLRKELIWLIGKFPYVMNYIARYLRPEDLASYLNEVADVFNSWYDKERILDNSSEGMRNLKLAITYGVRTVMRNGLITLGLDVLDRI